MKRNYKKYYDKNKMKIQRNKVLKYLNAPSNPYDDVRKPYKKTLEKYNIKYDENLKKWI